MEDKNSPNYRRRKSIMIIDEKGNAKEILKQNQDKKKKEECSPNTDGDGSCERNFTKETKSKDDGDTKKTTDKTSDDNEVIIIDHEKRKAEEASKRHHDEKMRKEMNKKEEAASMDANEEKKEVCSGEKMARNGGMHKEHDGKEKVCHDKQGKNGEQPDKKVTFDEDHNKEYGVQKDGNKATPLSPQELVDGKTEHVRKNSLEDINNVFIPPILTSSNLVADSEILKDRNEDNIVAEGWMWKKRRIFCCFWHQKYFVLTKEGVLRYHKADGRRAPKGNWDMKEATGVDHHDLPSEECHPFRIIIAFPSSSLLLGFDEKNVKDYWVNVLNRTIQKK